MTDIELINACAKHDKAAEKQLFERFYSSLFNISLRYSKNKSQANQLFTECFSEIYCDLPEFDSSKNETLDVFVTKKFIQRALVFIKNIRNEYYVASTVRATETKRESYDLFLDSTPIEFNKIDKDVLLTSIQQLVPSQRVVFNLVVIDGFTIPEISQLLETSEQAIKANLEKSRFNLQKGIEKNVKQKHYEQSL